MLSDGGGRVWARCGAGRKGEVSEASRCSGELKTPVGGTSRRRIYAGQVSAPSQSWSISFFILGNFLFIETTRPALYTIASHLPHQT